MADRKMGGVIFIDSGYVEDAAHVGCLLYGGSGRGGVVAIEKPGKYNSGGLVVVFENLRKATMRSSGISDDRTGRTYWIDEPKLTPAECTELLRRADEKRDRERTEADERRKKYDADRAVFAEKVSAIRPEWAKAVLIAVEDADNCDLQSDYFNHKEKRRVLLAWSKHTRDLFPEMRKAARKLQETAHLADADKDAEHREKYSMGGGYYLKAGYRHATGWRVEKLHAGTPEQVARLFAAEIGPVND